MKVFAVFTLLQFLRLHLVKKDWRLVELIKDKHHYPYKKDDKLHRDFQKAVHHQTHPAFSQGFSGQITLHLRLVGTKIGKKEKNRCRHARPEIIAVRQVKFKVYDIEFVHFPCHMQGLGKLHWKHVDNQDPCQDHPAHHDAHLLFVRDGHRLCSAGNSINNDDDANKDVGKNQVPAQ